MSAAVLLAPGDVIQRSTEELRQRQIQIHLVDWEKEDKGRKEETEERSESGGQKEKEKEKDEETPSKRREEKKTDEKDANEDEVRRVDAPMGHRPSDYRSGEREKGPSDGGRDKVKGGDRNDATRTGGNGTGGGRWLVGSEEIAQCLQNRYGVSIPVYKPGANGTFINLEKSLQKELGFSREMAAEQTEALRTIKSELKKRKMAKPHAVKNDVSQKSDKKWGKGEGNDGVKKGEGKDTDKHEDQDHDDDEGGKMIAESSVSSSERTPDLAVEDVMSQKKLLSMIGGGEKRDETIRARETSVMLVSNSIDDVAHATAYFTAPTGDTKWKEVARAAAKKSNIMAYTSEEGDIKKNFLHLIDHL
ncbi:VP6 protein [Epizootic hemorrhagic disease virus (serotype 1 / strain New Jersey)]|uniref:VP6 protein n=1 Tax=Epizootic hemorrhagic disease virus (serotype 1 / strain New Jersey) TaxID=449133 RepID=C8TE66_EHDV1|nr:VP6 protein [Epizootic hemorrhagic disease virus (serotype 1 / strain New Jersey)]CAN89085.1 VP6 protein [Epizootic hemorrhagic disease virus (serotype 1 / strain New Jersey)]